MRPRVGSAPPTLAVTGKGLREGWTQSRRAGKSPTEAAASIEGDSVADEKRAQKQKRQPPEKRAALRDMSSGQRERAIGCQKRDITTASTRASSCHSASRQHASHFMQPSRHTAVEVSLVHNLKKQILCLETQLRVLKQQQDTMARAHCRPTAGHDGEPMRASVTLATARLTSVDLPLPHARRIRHKDAAAASVTAAEPDDVAMARMREIPAAYQTERSALLHNVESLTKDVEGLQKLVLHLGRERDLMAAEVVDFRAALREMKIEHEAMAAECAATHRLLETEQALRRAAEENVRQSTAAASPHRNVMTTADAVSQRDYYKLQAERTAEALTLAKARIDTVLDALHGEREAAKTLETQLCSALDRIALMERREDELALYYQQLSGRFVTVSATLRHVLDVVPNELLQLQRAPSPERVLSGPSEAAKMTMNELRGTLDLWRHEAEAGAAKRQGTAEAITDCTVTVLDGVTARTTTDVSGVDDGPPIKDDEATVTSPRPLMEVALQSKLLSPPLPNPFAEDNAVAPSTVASQESARDNATLRITQTLRAVPQSPSSATETPAAHPLPTTRASMEGVGDAGSPICGGEKGHGGCEVSATLPEKLYGASGATTEQLPLLPVPKSIMTLGSALTENLIPSTQETQRGGAKDARDGGVVGAVPAKPDESNLVCQSNSDSVLLAAAKPVTAYAPALESGAVYHAVEVHAAARRLADRESCTEHVAFDSAGLVTSKQTAEVADNSVAVHSVEGVLVDGASAPTSSGDMLGVLLVTVFPADTTRLPQIPTSLHAVPTVHIESDGDPAVVVSSLPPRLDGEEPPAFHLSPPSAFAVPPPPPPNLVSVPLPPTIPSTPAALVPPTLEEQLVLLNARIDAQEAALVEMVRKHQAL